MSDMHTEEQARELWCPFGLTPHYARDIGLQGVVAANRAERSFEDDVTNAPERGIPTCHCIASKCMMWRWGVWQTSDGVTHSQRVKVFQASELLEEAVPVSGFCGLAGRAT